MLEANLQDPIQKKIVAIDDINENSQEIHEEFTEAVASFEIRNKNEYS